MFLILEFNRHLNLAHHMDILFVNCYSFNFNSFESILFSLLAEIEEQELNDDDDDDNFKLILDKSDDENESHCFRSKSSSVGKEDDKKMSNRILEPNSNRKLVANVRDPKNISNSEIIIRKISKECQKSFDKSQLYPVNEATIKNSKLVEINDLIGIEIEDASGKVELPIDEDSNYSDTELILSQRKKFLRKKSKMNLFKCSNNRSLSQPLKDKKSNVKRHHRFNKENNKPKFSISDQVPKVVKRKLNDEFEEKIEKISKKKEKKLGKKVKSKLISDEGKKSSQNQFDGLLSNHDTDSDERSKTENEVNVRRSPRIKSARNQVLNYSHRNSDRDIESNDEDGVSNCDRVVIERKKTEIEANLRRSPRIKSVRKDGKFLKTIYEREMLRGFDGKNVAVQKICGFEEKKSDLNAFREKFERDWLNKYFNRRNGDCAKEVKMNKGKFIEVLLMGL